MNKNIEESQVSILLEIDGEIHLVGMSNDRFDAITTMIKGATEMCIPTGKSQGNLNEFLGYSK